MRVVCDNCGMSYKIPDSKLTKEVNKATCRKCGHAIYIRRPDLAPVGEAPVAAADERTLITSQSEQLAAARQMSWQPAEGASDATNPRGGAPVTAPAPARPAPGPTLAPVSEPVLSVNDGPSRPRVDAPLRPPRPPEPEPEPARPAPAAASGYDPRTDMTVILLSAMACGFGVLLLVVNSLVGSGVVLGAGTFISLFGAFMVVFIVLTGGWGSRAASWVASVGGGVILAGLGTAFAIGASWWASEQGYGPIASGPLPPPTTLSEAKTVTAEPEPVKAEPPKVEPPVVAAEPPPVVTPPPAEPPPAAPAAAAKTDAPPAAKTTTVVASTPAATTKTTTTAAPATTTKTAATTSTTKTTTTTTTSTARTTTPTTSTAPPAASSSSSSPISPTVIDTMIKSNKAVKSCFVNEKNASGAIPSGVKVKFTIQPTGKVSSASIPSGTYAGTDFDGCLSGAMKSIQFPPFSGDAMTMTYKFPV